MILRHNESYENLVKQLKARRQTLGFAESCTGGLTSATLCEISGVSEVFLGSIVSYSNEIKTDLLGVPSEILKQQGAVSAPVALLMAKGAKKVLKTSWALSITGIAGPGGGSKEKPVGTVFFAVAGPQLEMSEKQAFSGERAEIQRQAADYAVTLLLKLLDK